MTKRNCNLDLRLHDQSTFNRKREELINGSLTRNQPLEQPQQQLNIMCNGRVCFCDVTELQARAILKLASGEMFNRFKTPNGSSGPNSPTLPSQLYNHSFGLSMTRSLQGFLQKRRSRIQATSPYRRSTKVETWSAAINSKGQ